MKVVLIGYGYWGKILRRYLEGNNRFNLVGICDPVLPDNSLTLEKIISDSSIECAFVCTPVASHFKLVEVLLKAGKYVFCEKPLCRSFEETQRLYELSDLGSGLLYVDYLYTVSPSIFYIKKNLYQLGRIKYIDMSIKQFGKFYLNESVIEIVGVHMFSVLAYYFPNKNMKVVDIDIIEKNDMGDIEDCIISLMTDEFRIRIRLSIISIERERKITIICERGSFLFDMYGEHTVTVAKYHQQGCKKSEEILIKKSFDESNNLEASLLEFCKCIENRNDNRRVALSVAQILDASISQINKF